MQKSLFITVSICSSLVLGSASQIHAQSTYPIGGTAGFETGLHQLVGNLQLDHVAHLGDANPLGAVIHWGDNTLTEPGLLVCHGTGLNTNPCDIYGTHLYTSAGPYTITIEYDDLPTIPGVGNGPRQSLTTTATISAPSDFVILSIGDSIASGEGNPVLQRTTFIPQGQGNYPDEGFWDDAYSNDLWPYPQDEVQEWPNQSFPCHRSILAGPVQAGQEIQSTNPGVTFIHYACSGAKINYTDTTNTAAQDAVGQLRVARGRLPRIDVLLISAGANSLYGPNSFGNGFGSLVNYCLHTSNDCDSNAKVSSDLDTTFKKLPSEYANLAKEINCINPTDGTPEPSCKDPQNQIPKLVLITEYMDPTHNAQGSFPLAAECPPYFALVDQPEWAFFKGQVVDPLNHAVDIFPEYAALAGLAVPTYSVGVAQDFQFAGICAGASRWVNNIEDSQNLLGPATPPGTNVENPPSGNWINGAAHPNSARSAGALGFPVETIDPVPPNCSPKCGQEDYRDRIYDAIVNYNPPVTTVRATAGGTPYPFGKWATQDVVVTLSATNSLKEAGVQQTYYAVDDPNCNFAAVSDNPNNPLDCSIYQAPFSVSTSGKHTVTFFSLNAHGNPEALQSVQVWVDKNPPLSSLPNTMTIPQGESASYAITLGHAGWTGQTIKMSCSADASLTQCTMLPTSVTLDATNSNTSVATVVTTLGSFPALGQGTLPPATGTRPNPFHPLALLRLLLALMATAFLFGMGRALRAGRWVPVTQFAAIALFFGLLCVGCNSAAQPPSTPKGTYTVTITGTDGTTTNTVKTTLIVK